MMGTTLVTSGLGFVYWWAAARQYSPEVVGFANASISAMMLLGTVGVLGFGTLLIGELPRWQGQKLSLIATALLVVGIVGGMLGVGFALIAPIISPELAELSANAPNIFLFALGVAVTSMATVVDQAAIGLLRGGMQLLRNSIFAFAKLIILLAISLSTSSQYGLLIYGTWLAGNVISVMPLFVMILAKGETFSLVQFQWRVLKHLGRSAIVHHALNLSLQFPTLVLPVMVTALLSARMNAYFYAAWMITSFIFATSIALTTVLYAVGAGDPAALAQKIRLTLRLSAGVSLAAVAVLLIGAEQILHLFGEEYAQQAGWSLRLLGLAAFPLIVRNHYMAICRIQGRKLGQTAAIMFVAGLFELGLAGVGATLNGLLGLCAGWAIAIFIEALLMLRVVYRAARPPIQPLSIATTAPLLQ